MKRAELIKRLNRIAKAKGLALEPVRDTGPHEIFRLGSLTIPVARHREINEYTAQGILKAAEKQEAATKESDT
ncbi:MAG: type II toxin-antitoxin system HicA family toxin [Acidimicrobiia bacterium]